jgi:hypothetical protein
LGSFFERDAPTSMMRRSPAARKCIGQNRKFPEISGNRAQRIDERVAAWVRFIDF